MTTVPANDVRIPPAARAALARQEDVLVLSHGRPVFMIVNARGIPAGAEDRVAPRPRRGRPLREALEILARAPLPDPGFAEDVETFRREVGPAPGDPWERC